MSRIIYPVEFNAQLLLFATIKQKHDELGAASPLHSFLLQQEINFSDAQAQGVLATTHEKNRQTLSKTAENHTQKRDLLFNPVMSHLRAYFQYLKMFYKPNLMAVGIWGAPITTTGKINYPNHFVKRTLIASLLKGKYDTFAPGTSPLDNYLTQHGLSIAADIAAVNLAIQQNNLAMQLAKDSENATENRNLHWNPVLSHIRIIGAFLMKLYTLNSKELGNFGFTVDDSPRAHKTITSKVKLGSQKSVNGVIIGGTFKNTGTAPLYVYKGAKQTGIAHIVPAGEILTMVKGMSTITIVNPSTTITGIFSVIRRR